MYFGTRELARRRILAFFFSSLVVVDNPFGPPGTPLEVKVEATKGGYFSVEAVNARRRRGADAPMGAT